jgi:hypothetical protein
LRSIGNTLRHTLQNVTGLRRDVWVAIRNIGPFSRHQREAPVRAGIECAIALFSCETNIAWSRSCENSELPCSSVWLHLAWQEAFPPASSKQGTSMAGAMSIAIGDDYILWKFHGTRDDENLSAHRDSGNASRARNSTGASGRARRGRFRAARGVQQFAQCDKAEAARRDERRHDHPQFAQRDHYAGLNDRQRRAAARSDRQDPQ